MGMNAMAVLFVRDAKAARDFYVDVLRMTVTADFGGMNFIFKEGFALWQPEDGNIVPRTLGSGNIHQQSAVSRFELCFETNDIDTVYLRLRENDVRFLHEMNEEPWGQRTVRFYDPDGHLIEFGEALPVFVERIYQQEGRNVEATAKRAYMQADMVKSILGL